MQITLFLYAALFSASSFVTAEPAPQPDAQTTKTPTPSQTAKAISDVDSYFSSVTAAPAWPSYSSIIYEGATRVDLDVFKGLSLSDVTTQTGFTDLASSVQSYIVSIKKVEESIISKDLSGAAPKPTGAVMAAGAVLAGALGVAAML